MPVLEPKTYRVLGEQRVVVQAGGSNRVRPGTILYHQVVLEAGWTGAGPHRP